MLWANALFPLWDSVTHSAHTDQFPHRLNKHTKLCCQLPGSYLQAHVSNNGTVGPTEAIMKSGRSFRSDLIKTFRQNDSSLCVEVVCERGSKPCVRGITTKASCFHDCWGLHAYDLGHGQQSPSPSRVRQASDSKGFLDGCLVWVCARSSRGRELFPEPRMMALQVPKVPCSPRHFVLWRAPVEFPPNRRNCPSRAMEGCVCVGVWERDITHNAQMLTGREQAGTNHIINWSTKSVLLVYSEDRNS